MTNMTTTTRRTFFKTSAMAAAGIGLSPRSWAQVRGANDDALGINLVNHTRAACGKGCT